MLLLYLVGLSAAAGAAPPPVVYFRPIGVEDRAAARPEGELRNGGHRTPARIIPS